MSRKLRTQLDFQPKIPAMFLIILRVVYALTCAGALLYVLKSDSLPAPLSRQPFLAYVVMFVLTQLVTFVDILVPRKRLDLISAIYFGLLIGVLLAYLLSLALTPFVGDAIDTTRLLLFLIMPYVCISLLLQTKDDFRFVIPYVEFAKEVKGGRPLVLDTSALIDGRIADILDTNIFDSELLVPDFVLQEVQDIADSGDKMRRARGRRGLDVLAKMQQNPKVEVRMYDSKGKDIEGQNVDQRIVSLAKLLGGRVVTNDFNLNKVASVQGVDVINLNDVANALKPRYLPGEHLRIRVIREGESYGQGIGYLDDGTMVVCEQAASLIGKDIDVVVSSVLQNSAGRMIFGRLAVVATPTPTSIPTR
jgi:uncharacterized protein YacL